MKKVVTIGGGTGSFMLLSGLKKYPVALSAIVSMADDGGSTGVLRDELGVLPPGDVRQCLVALSDSSEILRNLMSYRFEDGGLKGHSFGNLFLSALEKMTGGFDAAVAEAAKILKITGEVIPVTTTDTTLVMELGNGKTLTGEHEINTSAKVEQAGVKRLVLSPRPQANKRAIARLIEADLIVIGPGNHYCSVVPNLLVPGIAEAIRRSQAKVVYNANLVNKRGHTDGYALEDYVREVNGFIGAERIDFVTFNTKQPNPSLLRRYAEEDGGLVVLRETVGHPYRVIRGDFLNTEPTRRNRADAIAVLRSFIRHDSDKLARVLLMLPELPAYEAILRDIG